jgi:hypothetical protein
VEHWKGRVNDSSVASDRRPPKRRRSGRQAGIRSDLSDGAFEETDQLHERNPVAASKVQLHAYRESRKSARVGRNTLDAVKRSLLGRSDWMGLNAARPLHMEFPSAQEMENIGRRRKITVKDREGLEEAHIRPSRYTAQYHRLNHRQFPHRIDDIRDEVPSIRIGSNIHHSQTTPMPSRTHNPRSVVYQSESSDSMLLDKEVPSYQQSNDIQSSPEHVMAAPSGPTEKPARESIGMPLVSLDRVRDSETFDEVKARSDSLMELSYGSQQQKHSRGTKRRAANRGLASEQAESSSIVTGRRLLQSASSRSPCSDSQPITKAVGITLLPRQKRPQQAPDSLSSDFLPPLRGPGYSCEETMRTSSCGIRELPSRSDNVIDPSLPNHFVPRRAQNHPEYRSKFTLEHQIEADVETRDTDIVSNAQHHQIDNSPGMAPKKHTKTVSDMHLLGSKIQQTSTHAPAPRKRRGPELTESSPALMTAKRHGTPAESTSRRRHGTDQSLHSSGKTKQKLELPQTTATARKRGPQRQLLHGKPMRQRLGIFGQLASQPDDKDDLEPQRDENQAWMRFVLQDEPSAISNHFDVKRSGTQKTHRLAPRWLRHHADDDKTLPEDLELRSTHTSKISGFSPVQTVRTTANTALHEANADTDGFAKIRSQPSETDFLSQMSPMEGYIDERLLNTSIYTNPARTERSYIAAPSRTTGEYEKGTESDFLEPHSRNVHDSSPIQSTHNNSHLQGSNLSSSPAQLSRSRTATSRSNSHRTPLRPISNLFTEPKPSPLNPPRRASRPFNKFSQSQSVIAHASIQDNMGCEWADSAPVDKTPSSARRKVCVFPLNYTPITHVIKKRQRDQWAGLRPLSSYSTTSQADPRQNVLTSHKLHLLSHSKTASHDPPSLPARFPHPDIHDYATGFRPCDPIPHINRHSPQHDITSISPLPLSPPPLFSTPLQPPHLSPDHFIFFKKPPPLLDHKPITRPPEPPFSVTAHGAIRRSRSPAQQAPFTARGPTRQPLSPAQAMPFSTPRPMRMSKPVTPLQAQPFSTPRPVKPVLGSFRPPERLGGLSGGWAGA